MTTANRLHLHAFRTTYVPRQQPINMFSYLLSPQRRRSAHQCPSPDAASPEHCAPAAHLYCCHTTHQFQGYWLPISKRLNKKLKRVLVYNLTVPRCIFASSASFTNLATMGLPSFWRVLATLKRTLATASLPMVTTVGSNSFTVTSGPQASDSI